MSEEYLNLTQAATLMDVSRVAVFYAIMNGRIPYKKDEKGRFIISFNDLDWYVKTKYDRKETLRLNKEKVYVNGRMSLMQISKKYGVCLQNLYHATRNGELKYVRVGRQMVVEEQEIKRFLAFMEEKQVVSG